MREKIKHMTIEILRASLFLIVSALFIAVVALNNSALLVTGSSLGVALVRTPMPAQMLALIIMIVTIFIIVYQVIRIKWYYLILIFLFSFSLFTIAMHTFAWNYTQNKVQDIWLLMPMQEIPTVTKNPDVQCRLGRTFFQLSHASGKEMRIIKGIYPWVLKDRELVTGCKNKTDLDKLIKLRRQRKRAASKVSGS